MKTVQEVVAALNFPVSLRPNMAENAVGNMVRGIGVQVLREDKNIFIAQNSDTYGLIKHGDCLAPVLAALDGMDYTMKDYYMDHEGRRVMVKALSKQSWNIGKLADGGDDEVRLTLMLTNSYDRTAALKVMVGVYRMICSNGLVVSHPAFKGLNVEVKIVHSQNQTKKLDVGALGNSVARLYGAMEKQVEVYIRMKQTVIDRSAIETLKLKVIEPITGERAVDLIMDKALNGKGQDGNLTLWALYNGFTEVLSGKLEKSKSPVQSHALGNTKNLNFIHSLNTWAAENQALVTVNA